MKSFFTLAGAMCLCTVSLAAENARVQRMRVACEEKARRPNIIWIMADDLGWGDIGCYGSTKIPTPNLDRLAGEGMRFTDAHSPSAVCSPTRYGVLTGTDPFRRYHTSHVLFNGEPLAIAPHEATIASVLSDAGYATAVVGKWHLGLGDAMPRDLAALGRGPNEIGFDFSFLVPDGHNMFPRYYLRDGRPWGDAASAEFPTRLTLINRLGYTLLEHKPTTEWPNFRPDEEIGAVLTEQAVAWLEASTAKENRDPFFLYLPTCAIHDPHRPDPRFVGESEVGRHGDYVMQFDWTVGEILDALKRLGVAEDTLVFVTSDNGGLPGTSKLGHDTSGPWRGHKSSAWEGGHRVPLLARWPGRVEAGAVSDALVSLCDLTATASTLAGGFVPPEGGLDSIDQSPVLLGEQSLVRDALMMATRGCAQIVRREGSHKITLDTASGVVTYVNLETDPAEESPMLIEDAPARAREMLDRLHRHFTEGASRPRAIGRRGSVQALFDEKQSRNEELKQRFAP